MDTIKEHNMKLRQTVTLTQEEINKMLTKFVEKKLGKKVVAIKDAEPGDEGVQIVLEEVEVTEEKKEG